MKETHRSRRRCTFGTGDLPDEQAAAFLSRVLHCTVFIFAFFNVFLHARRARVKACDLNALGQLLGTAPPTAG